MKNSVESIKENRVVVNFCLRLYFDLTIISLCISHFFNSIVKDIKKTDTSKLGKYLQIEISVILSFS